MISTFLTLFATREYDPLQTYPELVINIEVTIQESKNGERRLEKSKNNDEIKQRKGSLKSIRLEVFCGDNTQWSLSCPTRSRGIIVK